MQDVAKEKTRLLEEFAGADEAKIKLLDGLLEQAAHERCYLVGLNAQAAQSGLVQLNPKNVTQQRTLPVSAEIARHAATLTNIMDKLLKHLTTPADDDDDGLTADYE